MDIQSEKIELIKLLLDTEKESLIEKIKAVFAADEDVEDISKVQEEELEYRLNRNKRGETKFYDWKTVERKLKDAL